MVDILTEGGGLLGDRDYTLILDNSEFMAQTSEDGDFWSLSENATLAIANKCEEYDFNGLSFYLYGDKFSKFEHIKAHEIAHIFDRNKPQGKANLAPVLETAINDYFQRRLLGYAKSNGETLIVILASLPESPQQVEKLLINAANQIQQDEELAILFVQVGFNQQLKELLTKWDQNLIDLGAKFDICDRIQLEEIQPNLLAELLLKAIID